MEELGRRVTGSGAEHRPPDLTSQRIARRGWLDDSYGLASGRQVRRLVEKADLPGAKP